MDEGHNVEDVCRDAGSTTCSSELVAEAVARLEDIANYSMLGPGAGASQRGEALRELSRLTTAFKGCLLELSPSGSGGGGGAHQSHPSRLPADGSQQHGAARWRGARCPAHTCTRARASLPPQGIGDGGYAGEASPTATSEENAAVPLTSVAARAEAALAAKARAASNQAAAAAAAASLVQKYSGHGQSAVARNRGPPPPPPQVDVCLVLPATYFNGTALSSTTTRGLGACCELCRRKAGCAAYNWRPEPLARNCVLFGMNYGVPRGTALSSAGVVRVPLDRSQPQPHLSWSMANAEGDSAGARRGKRKPGRARKRRLLRRNRKN